MKQKYHRWFQWFAVPFVALAFHIYFGFKVIGKTFRRAVVSSARTMCSFPTRHSRRWPWGIGYRCD